MVATGVLTVYVALSGVRNGSATGLVVASAAGVASVGLMAVVNLMLRSDFRWPAVRADRRARSYEGCREVCSSVWCRQARQPGALQL